jgi:hypothetical protein
MSEVIMSEVTSGVKRLPLNLYAGMEVVKCSGWTDAFHARILKARNSELAMLLKVGRAGRG